MRKIIELKLKYLAKLILWKYKPAIIGITGSIGKSSAKEAITTVLSKKMTVRSNIKNYNNEIGLPLTILGEDSPGRSIFGWLIIFFKAFFKIIIRDRNYPAALVLEMGADKPGDMKYLTAIAKPQVGVITAIGPAHLEFFGTVEKIKEEKSELIKAVATSGWAVLNYDDERTRAIATVSKARVITYGLNDKASIQAREIQFSFRPEGASVDLSGINFKLGYEGSFVPVVLPKVIGQNAVYAALAGASVGLAYGLNLVEISEALRAYIPLPGRMNLINGLKNTKIVDDTYNSSPPAALAALETLRLLPVAPGRKKYAVLGDMLELGNYSDEGHREVGQKAGAIGLDCLAVVGNHSRITGQNAIKSGLTADKVFYFSEALSAGHWLQSVINAGDIILVKGSQGMRLEKVVKKIMAEPARAEELLVRMDKTWANR